MMTSTCNYSGGTTFNTTVENSKNDSKSFDVMKILQLVIACLGITTNLIVIVVFLNHKKLRRKVPNICINEVSVLKYEICIKNRNYYCRYIAYYTTVLLITCNINKR